MQCSDFCENAILAPLITTEFPAEKTKKGVACWIMERKIKHRHILLGLVVALLLISSGCASRPIISSEDKPGKSSETDNVNGIEIILPIKDVSIPDQNEPQFRSERASVPESESHHSGNGANLKIFL